MNRMDFIDGLHKYGTALSREERQEIMTVSLALDGSLLKSIIIMEELAELQKEVSKKMRGQGDEFALLEEIADVHICLQYLMKIYNFSDTLLDRAITTKLMREKERLEAEWSVRT